MRLLDPLSEPLHPEKRLFGQSLVSRAEELRRKEQVEASKKIPPRLVRTDCSEPSCKKKHFAAGFCRNHYEKMRYARRAARAQGENTR